MIFPHLSAARRRSSVFIEALEQRILFSFVIQPASTSISATAAAGSSQIVNTNPAHAADSFTGGGFSQFQPAYTLNAASNANYQGTPTQLTLHDDATQSSTPAQSLWPDNSGADSGTTLTFTLTAAAAVQIDGSLSGSGGGASTINLEGTGITASSSTASALHQLIHLAAGSYTIAVTASAADQAGPSDSAAAVDVTLTLGAGTPPHITSPSAVTFRLGQPSNFTVTTNGSPTPSLKETAFLPGGISFVDNGDGTATLAGTPKSSDAIGNYDLIFTASNGVPIDSTHPSASQFFTLTLASSLTKPPLPPTHLVISQQPATTTIAGTTISPVMVLVEDKTGHVVSTDSSLVHVSLVGTPGATLHGNLSAQAGAGVALFNDLSITKAGTYSLALSDGSLTGTKTISFIVNPDSKTAHLLLTQAPASSILVGKLLAPFTVVAQDQFGNIIKNNQSAVTLSVANGPTKGALLGTPSVHLANGVATFKKVSLSQAGNYTLQLSDPALAANVPINLSITATPGSAAITPIHPAASYKSTHSISLTTTLKSTLSPTIPFTAIATLKDQNNNILATSPISASGSLHFLLVGLLPAVYSCTITCAGDPNRLTPPSAPFTLNVTK